MKCVPCIKDSVAGLLERHSGLLESAPVCQHLGVFVKLAGLGNLLPEDPYTFIKISYLISVVVVCSPAAAVCKTLVDCMVNRIDYSWHVGGVSCVHVVKGTPIDDFLYEADPHFAKRVVELIVTHKRSARNGAVRKSLDAVFLEMLLHAAHKSVGGVFFSRITTLCPFVKSGLDHPEHLRLIRIHRVYSPHRILFPLPEAAPLPHVSCQIVIVLRNLLVWSDLVMKFILGESDSIYIYSTGWH